MQTEVNYIIYYLASASRRELSNQLWNFFTYFASSNIRVMKFVCICCIFKDNDYEILLHVLHFQKLKIWNSFTYFTSSILGLWNSFTYIRVMKLLFGIWPSSFCRQQFVKIYSHKLGENRGNSGEITGGEITSGEIIYINKNDIYTPGFCFLFIIDP